MTINNIQALFAESLNELELTDKQKAVLRASLTLFSEKGFNNTSTSDIAQMAGVSEGTVYKQFKTKEGILAAIIGPFIQRVVPKAAHEFTEAVITPPYPDFSRFLETVIKNRMDFAVDNMPQLRIVLQEAITNQEMLTGLGHLLDSLISGPLGTAFRHYQKSGELIKWPLIRIARYLVTTIMGYILPAALANQPVDTSQASKEAAEFLIRGLTPS